MIKCGEVTDMEITAFESIYLQFASEEDMPHDKLCGEASGLVRSQKGMWGKH